MIQHETLNGRDYLTVTLTDGPFEGKRFGLDLKMCNSPTCACTTVHLDLLPPKGNGFDHDLTAASFGVNVTTKKINHRPQKTQKALATQFMENADDNDWNVLAHAFVEFKKKVCEDVNLDDAHFEFPVHAIEEHCELISYYEVFPFAEGVELTLGGERFLADEQYCVKEQCDCREVYVTFIPMKHLGTKEKGHVVKFDHRRKTHKLERPGESKIDPNDLTAALLERKPEFYLQAGKHHKTLKDLYKRYRREHPTTVDVLSEKPKLGRNDPCLCGSGKKYKKCCLDKPAELKPRQVKRIHFA